MGPNAYGELDELDVTEPMTRVAAPTFGDDWRPMYRAIESEIVPMSASRAADGTRPRPSRPSLPPPKRPSTASIPQPMPMRPSGPVAAAPQYIDNYGSDRVAMRRAPGSRGRRVMFGGALVVGVLGVIAGLTYATAHTSESAARVEPAPAPAIAPAPAVVQPEAPAVAVAPVPAAVAVAPAPAAVKSQPVAVTPKPAARPSTPPQPAIASAPAAAPQPAVAHAAPETKQPASHSVAPTRVAAAPAPAPAPAPAAAPAPAPAAKPTAQAAAIAANEGALKISTTVPCEIYVDGKATHKVTPQRSLRLAAGSHSLLLVNDVARVHKEVSVTITAGYSTALDVATP